ncbi:innexin inx3 [Daphnia magna]|uniref:innexin inx3 n=1 Tax=Daphnia magna TaxID=35525 RepID=UPI001E1BC00D|nr:innexin inx3 [Daphnia magna]
MSVVGLLAGIGAFFKVRYLHDKAVIDNPVFRLHYRFTSAFFFAACVLTTAFNFFGNPISCITGEPFSRPEALNTYCWLHSTFTLASQEGQRVGIEFAHPGVGAEKSDSEHRYHNYYQWVPFVLFLQGVLFYLPHWLWKMNEGGRVRDMTGGSRGTSIGQEGARHDHCAALFSYLVQTMRYHRNLIAAYVTCELLNFANVVGNIYFINRFLNGAFLTYGTRVVQLSDEDQEDRADPMVEVFPRMTKCNFHMYGSSGTIQKIDALCLLPLNIANEKIYIFLWFWLIILSVITGLALIYRLAMFMSPTLRLFLIRRLASPSKASTETVVWRVPVGDYFLLHMLGKNLEGFLFNRLMDDLAKHLTSNASEAEERRRGPFTRQTSKLSELMSSVGKRASFRAEPKAIYLPMEESSITKSQSID